jgi:hypothetical protein
MIQRKQTIWLLLSAAVLIPLWFIPFASFLAGEEEALIFMKGLLLTNSGTMTPATMRFVILIFATLVPILTIFFYKHRKAQLEFCLSNIILSAVLVGMIVVDWYTFSNIDVAKIAESGLPEVHEFKLNLFICITPLLSMGMNYLAYRRIMYDELLIKSIDRIR